MATGVQTRTRLDALAELLLAILARAERATRTR